MFRTLSDSQLMDQSRHECSHQESSYLHMLLKREQSLKHSGHTTSLCSLAKLEALGQLEFLAGVKSPHVAKIKDSLNGRGWGGEAQMTVINSNFKCLFFSCQLTV